MYREVLIAGDLTQEDKDGYSYYIWEWIPYGMVSDTAKLVYGNDTIYFAQPSLSQFIPGGSGAGTLNMSGSIVPDDTPNNTPLLTDRNASNGDIGVVLRYAPPAW